ncbi:MAG TPA: AMIN domain-containing protein [bacterium]|nr:AMIN domain-containing protein [bacterium]
MSAVNLSVRVPHRAMVIAGAIACAVIGSIASDGRAASPALVTRVTAAETSENVQVSIVSSAPVRYQLVKVQPNWIVLEIAPAKLKIQAGTLPFAGDVVKRIRVGQFSPQVVRIVVEMARPSPFRVITSRAEVEVFVAVPETMQRPVGATHAASASPTPNRGPQGPLLRLHTVLPGEGIGPVLLGMRIQDALTALGPAKNRQVLPDGNTLYEWFAPPSNSGLGLRVTAAGMVYRVWALNDDQYTIGGGVHVGSTEAFARAALGEPSQVVADPSRGIKTLNYSALGLWVAIQTDHRYAYYGKVFEIGVTQPQASSAGP